MCNYYCVTDPKLELVAGPQCPVIEVAAWLTLFDKLAPRRKLRSRLETTADDSLASAPPCLDDPRRNAHCSFLRQEGQNGTVALNAKPSQDSGVKTARLP
jgi:hypothetical protein